MRVIRASEIGSYLYCRRAWSCSLQGIQSENQADLTAGSEFHRQHGVSVLQSRFFQMMGVILLLLALMAAAVSLTLLLIR